MSRKEIKAEAKDKLRGNWGWAVLVFFIDFIVCSILAGGVTAGTHNGSWKYKMSLLNPEYYYKYGTTSTIMGIITGFIALSLVISFLNFRDGKKDGVLKAAFSSFTNGRFGPEIINYLLSTVFTYLWTLLLIIPGFIKSYSYAMTPYIVSDMVASGKTVQATSGITASRKLMDGHKMELFVFNLSFLGWFILGLITLGIGFLWLVPYYQTSRANFYRALAGSQFK
ncbi:DUF975 family protein [Lactobacillus acetotolerans]|uniref:DUF975 family protein n=1 Tax=Lactobacillus acetotolerans TaxID=1600 RepID=UPI002FD9945E